LLQGRGFDCFEAPHGEAAIDQLSHHRFDVILLDLGLPFVNGREVIQWVLDHGLETPIVVSTTEDTDLASLGTKRVHSIVHKPAAVAQLIASMEAAIAGTPTEGSPRMAARQQRRDNARMLAWPQYDIMAHRPEWFNGTLKTQWN